MKYLLFVLMAAHAIINAVGNELVDKPYDATKNLPKIKMSKKHRSEMADSAYYYQRESFALDKKLKKEFGVNLSPRNPRPLKERITQLFRSKSSLN
jgi:hypothetical protein